MSCSPLEFKTVRNTLSAYIVCIVRYIGQQGVCGDGRRSCGEKEKVVCGKEKVVRGAARVVRAPPPRVARDLIFVEIPRHSTSTR